MAETYKQLGQLRQADTTATSVYSPSQGKMVIIKTIVIANTSGADATVRLFLDDDGTTYTEVTALAWDVLVPADSVVQFDGAYTMNNESGNFAYRTSVGDALTITLFGVEIS